MLCSAIMPMLNEELNVERACERVRAALEGLGCEWELICVDDGSSDRTFEILGELARQDSRVRVLRFSRNFGSHAAASAGFAVARGDVAFVVGADVQEPLHMLPTFIEKCREGYNVVWGVRTKRQDPALTRAFSRLFNEVFARLGMLSALPKGAGFAVVDRKVLEALRLFGERNRTVWGLIAWAGFRQAQVPCAFGEREVGRSRWTLGKKVKLAIDTFSAFSYAPIRLVSAVGLVISLVSFLYGLGIILGAAFGQVAVQGWPTLMVTILFLSGVQLVVTGMLGEYLWRALDEARARPLYIVADRIGFEPEAGDGSR